MHGCGTSGGIGSLMQTLVLLVGVWLLLLLLLQGAVLAAAGMQG
jgi:hypothetical protein